MRLPRCARFCQVFPKPLQGIACASVAIRIGHCWLKPPQEAVKDVAALIPSTHREPTEDMRTATRPITTHGKRIVTGCKGIVVNINLFRDGRDGLLTQGV